MLDCQPSMDTRSGPGGRKSRAHEAELRLANRALPFDFARSDGFSREKSRARDKYKSRFELRRRTMSEANSRKKGPRASRPFGLKRKQTSRGMVRSRVISR